MTQVSKPVKMLLEVIVVSSEDPGLFLVANAVSILLVQHSCLPQ